MKIYGDPPMSFRFKGLRCEGMQMARLSPPASVFVEVSGPKSKSVRIGIGVACVDGASQCRRTSVEIDCHRFNIGSASHHLRTIDSKWSGRAALASFGSRRLDE